VEGTAHPQKQCYQVALVLELNPKDAIAWDNQALWVAGQWRAKIFPEAVL